MPSQGYYYFNDPDVRLTTQTVSSGELDFPASTPFTIEFWYKTGTDSDMTLFDIQENDTNNHNRIHMFTRSSDDEIKIGYQPANY